MFSLCGLILEAGENLFRDFLSPFSISFVSFSARNYLKKTSEPTYGPCVGGNDTYGITRIPTTVAGRGVVRRADQTDCTRFVYPGSGREDA